MKTHNDLVALMLSDPVVQAAYDALASEFSVRGDSPIDPLVQPLSPERM